MTKIISILYTVTLLGCVSQIVSFDDFVSGWKGENINQYIEVRSMPHADSSDYVGVEKVSPLDNGHLLYEFPFPKCPVFFEVDESGVIIDIRTEGNINCY